MTAGTVVSITITVVDANGNPLTSGPNLSDTISIACGDPNSSFPQSVTLSSGTAAFNVLFETANTTPWTVTATDTDNVNPVNVARGPSCAGGVATVRGKQKRGKLDSADARGRRQFAKAVPEAKSAGAHLFAFGGS